MTDQGPAIPALPVPRERRPLGGAALAALGVYLVLTLLRERAVRRAKAEGNLVGLAGPR